MIPLSLPSGHRRAVRRSFWACVSTGVALVVVGAAHTVGLPMPLAWGVVIMGGVGLLAFSHEGLVGRFHGGWNRRLVRPLARHLARLVRGTCYFVVFAAVGRAGSRLPGVDGEDAARWHARTSLPPGQYGPPFPGVGGGSRRSWIANYVDWARRSDNLWALSLLPYLVLLKLLSLEEERVGVDNIYTLF